MARPDSAARLRETGDDSGLVVILVGTLLGVVGLATAWYVAAVVAGDTALGNPLAYVMQLAGGQARYSTTAWLVFALTIGVLLALAVGGMLWWRSQRRPGWLPIDRRSKVMASARDLQGMIEPGCLKDRDRLRVPANVGKGVPVARLVQPGTTQPSLPLYASYEWVQAYIMGPRAGKTSCVVVRQIIESTGPCLATSNKRDIVDLTRGVREQQGFCWVFDPQELIGEPASWWWNPLSFVNGELAKARELAGLFSSSSRDADARTDAYFDNAGESLAAALLLAASLADEPITSVWSWLSDPNDATPVRILRMAGQRIAAEAIDAIANVAEGQRDGVYGTARNLMDWLTNEKVLTWITDPSGERPQFDPRAFLLTRQTLYLISREGAGSARAVTAALAVAVLRAGEHMAGISPGGRLPVPLSVVLDEAANVVRWRDLPALYSHFGSRGMCLAAFFQSWSQGVGAYGRDGMTTLWSAANVRVVGAGLADPDFLAGWSNIVGERDVQSRDVSYNGNSSFGGRSTSVRLRREKVFEVSELAAMPRGRAIMASSGAPAALVELQPWMACDYADQVRASENYYANPHD